MLINRKIHYVVLSLLLIIGIILFYPNKVVQDMNPDISHKIKVISESHIYFGHQSVGENIVSGLNKIISGSGQNEFIVKELNNNNKILNSYYFVHSKIGNNGDPKGKFREFAKIVEILSRKNLELAMMKLCFVDINKNSNLENIFNSYVNTIDSLQKRYPNLTIVHFTVPIKSQPTWIKKIKAILMNRDLDDPQDNIARDKYNKLILAKYPKECIFDLAKAESTYPDDKREIIMVNGIPAYSMIKDFTDDGGHLNMKGQKVISRELIEKIFEIITMKKSIN